MTKPAFDFHLLNQNQEQVSLDQFKGKWVILYFYPKDNTPGCTIEARDFTHFRPEFEACHAKILGISPDSCKSHQNFIQKKNLAIDLLSDPEKEVVKAYGAWGGKIYKGLIRSTFIINPEGNIAASWQNVRAKGHAEKVLNKLRELLDG